MDLLYLMLMMHTLLRCQLLLPHSLQAQPLRL
jgi:hypothetical protein